MNFEKYWSIARFVLVLVSNINFVLYSYGRKEGRDRGISVTRKSESSISSRPVLRSPSGQILINPHQKLLEIRSDGD